MATKKNHLQLDQVTIDTRGRKLVIFLREKLVVSLSSIQKFLLAHFWLIVLGIVIEGFYLLYLLRQFPLWGNYQHLTDMGIINNFSHTGFITFLLVFSLLFFLLIIAQRCVSFYHDKATLYLILGLGFLFSLTLLFVYPINAIDIFGYIAESRVLVLYHANPLVVAPSIYTKDAFIQSLSSFAAIPSPYGPLEILIESVATLFSGANLLVNILLVKGLSALFLSGSSYLVYKIMLKYKPEIALSCVLILAWNPYVQLEYVVNSHNDIVMIFFVLLAIFAFLNKHYVAAFAFLLLSVFIKYASLPLLPLFFIGGIFSYSDLKERALYFIDICITTLIILLALILPFLGGLHGLTGFFTTVQGSLYSFARFLNDFSGLQLTLDQSKLIGFGIFGVFYLVALWFASRSYAGLLMGCFLTWFAFLTFAVTYVQPWYILWACIPALLMPRKPMQLSVLLLTYGATMVELIHPYVLAWGVYRNASAFAIVNSIAYLVLFWPTPLLLLGTSINEFITKLAQNRPVI